MPKHFASKEGYRKYVAFQHIHHIKTFDHGPVWISGKLHKVKHTLS